MQSAARHLPMADRRSLNKLIFFNRLCALCGTCALRQHLFVAAMVAGVHPEPALDCAETKPLRRKHSGDANVLCILTVSADAASSTVNTHKELRPVRFRKVSTFLSPKVQSTRAQKNCRLRHTRCS